jgi:hypothetical protein
MDNQKPLTIENQWDVLYRDYPEVYEEFGRVPYKPALPSKLNNWFHLCSKHILWVLARVCQLSIWQAMLTG